MYFLESETALGGSRSTRKAYSEAIEDFLKAVYLLLQEQERVSTSALAEVLGITAPSTTEMAKKLAKAKLVMHKPYGGIWLTSAGERVALEIIRNHRLLELFLVQALGYSWDEVHTEADRLEHAISERMAQRIAEYLGDPRFDPHGDPIPDPEGQVLQRDLTPLADLPPRATGIVARLLDQSPEMLQYLEQKGLVVGAIVEVLKIDPFEGPLTLRVGDAECVIGENAARYILMGKHGGNR